MVRDLVKGGSRQRSVIIVGAGPGGLAASILLAAAGLRVRIIERLPIIGGRTSSIEAEGFRFDLGPTFFLYPRVLEEIMRAAGTTLANEVELVRLDPQYRLIFGGGGQIDCTPDVASMERQITALAPADAGGFLRFLNENRQKLELMAPCLESAFHSWRDVFQVRLLRLPPVLRQHVLSADPSFYVQNASVTDPTLAPVSHQHPNIDWNVEKERFRALVLKQIAKAGFENVEPRIRFERMITPLEFDQQYEIHLGATFNLAHSLDQPLHLRPAQSFRRRARHVSGGRRHASGQRLARHFHRAESQPHNRPRGSRCRPRVLTRRVSM